MRVARVDRGRGQSGVVLSRAGRSGVGVAFRDRWPLRVRGVRPPSAGSRFDAERCLRRADDVGHVDRGRRATAAHVRRQRRPLMSDLEVLELMFGDLRFVYLWREDVIAQAVSWARAEQTNLWHAPIDGPDGGADTEPSFDREQIAELCATIDCHNQRLARLVRGSRSPARRGLLRGSRPWIRRSRLVNFWSDSASVCPRRRSWESATVVFVTRSMPTGSSASAPVRRRRKSVVTGDRMRQAAVDGVDHLGSRARRDLRLHVRRGVRTGVARSDRRHPHRLGERRTRARVRGRNRASRAVAQRTRRLGGRCRTVTAHGRAAPSEAWC